MAPLPDITALFVTLEDENSDLRYASPGLSKFEFTSTVKGTLVALYGRTCYIKSCNTSCSQRRKI